MAYRKKTLRKMVGTERKYAALMNDLESVVRRLKNLSREVGENARLWEATVRAQRAALARPDNRADSGEAGADQDAG